jgi:hypothetical protein
VGGLFLVISIYHFGKADEEKENSDHGEEIVH